MLLLGACIRTGVATTEGRPASRTSTAAPACITPPEAEGPITRVSAEGERVRFCVGPAADACFAFDVSTRALEPLGEPPSLASEGARVEVTNARLEVCTGTTCTPLTPKVLPTAAALQAATNPEGTLAVVLLGDPSAGRGHAEVWDVLSQKRIARFRYARGAFKCGQVAMAGDVIYVSASTCRSPSARAALYTRKGRRLANVGGRDFGTFGNAYTQLEDTTWAFLEENGNRVAIHDVRRGKLVKTIDVSALWTPDGEPDADAIGNPGESAIVRLGSGRLAVIAGAPGTGKLAVIDVASGTVEIVRAPVCDVDSRAAEVNSQGPA